MHSRALIVVIPVAILVSACSGAVARPSASAGPATPSAAVARATGTAPDTGSEAPSAVPSDEVPAGTSAAVRNGDINVTMTDGMRFQPDPVTVPAGVPITFVVENTGVIVHEFFVGTEEEQAEHAAEMALGAMGHGHANALRVDPGTTAQLTMTFAKTGSLLIGCHEPGHYEADMKSVLHVTD